MAEAEVQWGKPKTARKAAEGPQEPQEGEQTGPYLVNAEQTPADPGTMLQTSCQ